MVLLVSMTKKIAQLIAETWHKFGTNGILTVDRSEQWIGFVEMFDGITINRGYISPFMIDTNPQRMECVVENHIFWVH